MATDFLHVRVDPIKKREAEKILNSFGLTLTTGVNLCLNSIIRVKGLPFDVKLSREDVLGANAFQMETAFQKAVAESVAADRANGYPIALYDAERKCPYLEYPDGKREYDESNA
jgi:addiction module RelB/DinJ family antitoxin